MRSIHTEPPGVVSHSMHHDTCNNRRDDQMDPCCLIDMACIFLYIFKQVLQVVLYQCRALFSMCVFFAKLHCGPVVQYKFSLSLLALFCPSAGQHYRQDLYCCCCQCLMQTQSLQHVVFRQPAFLSSVTIQFQFNFSISKFSSIEFSLPMIQMQSTFFQSSSLFTRVEK